jgi:hypothetical protein
MFLIFLCIFCLFLDWWWLCRPLRRVLLRFLLLKADLPCKLLTQQIVRLRARAQRLARRGLLVVKALTMVSIVIATVMARLFAVVANARAAIAALLPRGRREAVSGATSRPS